MGTAHATVPPIFWEVVFVGFVRKHEQSKKGVIKELFSEIGGISYDITGRKDKKIFKRYEKFEKSWLMTKKGHHKFWAWKWIFFLKRRHSEILFYEIFSRPPKLGAYVNARDWQVSGLHLDYCGTPSPAVPDG